jgi:hypothetical protein
LRGSRCLLMVVLVASTGSVVGAAGRAATPVPDGASQRSIVREDTTRAAHASAAILTRFAVFGVTSRTGVPVGALRISRPRLSSVPLPILVMSRPSQAPDLDPRETRQATASWGARVWIVPGRHTLCVFTLEPGASASGHGGAAAGCTTNLHETLARGVSASSCCFSGYSWDYGVVPSGHPTVTIHTSPRATRTVRTADGVYIYRHRR